MKIFMFALIALLSGAAIAGTLADLQAKNGFRDIKFGESPANLADFTLVEKGKGSNFYSRGTDSLKIGGAELKSITYEIWDNKFIGVSIDGSGFSNCKSLQEALESAYGKGERPNKFMDRYLWVGNAVSMVYDYGDIKKSCSVFVWSKEMQKQKTAADKTAADKAASDL